jgi:replicative DNA helicase
MDRQQERRPDGADLFEIALRQIRERQERAALGNANCIPFPFKRTSHYYPGIEKGTYVICTANSGVGKSKLARYLYVISTYEFIKENPDIDIRLRIFYFSLEESREKFMMSIISYWLFRKYNIRVSIKQLRSVGEIGSYLSDDIISKIEEGREYFSDLERYVTIIDDISNPTGKNI